MQEQKVLITFFGATGDLASRKLYPALFRLFQKGFIRNHFAVIGTARREWTDEYFREVVVKSVQSLTEDVTQAEEFASHFYYQAHNVTDTHHYVVLKELSEKLDNQYGIEGNRIFYLAMAPSFFGTITQHLKDEALQATITENKPRVDIQNEEIPFTTITRETNQLPKGQSRIVTEGVNGRRSYFYSVTTATDGTEVKTLVTSVVAQEPVAQVIEVGNPVTHVGDEHGQAAIAEEKPKLEIPSKPAPASVPAEENKALSQGPAPVAKENKLPETGSQGSEWLIATGLMTALTAYGLSKKKD